MNFSGYACTKLKFNGSHFETDYYSPGVNTRIFTMFYNFQGSKNEESGEWKECFPTSRNSRNDELSFESGRKASTSKRKVSIFSYYLFVTQQLADMLFHFHRRDI